MPSCLDQLVAAAEAAQPADFSAQRKDYEAGHGPEPSIDAGLLRDAILGLRHPSFPPQFDGSRSIRWKIIGLSVTGLLDLCDARLPNGNPLPSLEFVDCSFTEGFAADDAHLRRLEFANCAFGTPAIPTPSGAQISLANIRIDGDLRFSHIRPLVPDSDLRIAAPSAHIGGNLRLAHLRLQSPRNQQSQEVLDLRYALDLRDAEIGASLYLLPRVTLDGGLMALGARIGSTVRLDGLQLTDGLDAGFRSSVDPSLGVTPAAMSLRTATIGGNFLALASVEGEPFRATGRVLCDRLTVRSSLWFQGAHLDAGNMGELALELSGVSIQGDLRVCSYSGASGNIPSRVLGVLSISGDVSGDLLLSGVLPNVQASGLRVHADADVSTTLPLKTKRELTKGNFTAYANINLREATITGSLNLHCSYELGEPGDPLTDATQVRGTVDLTDCSVGVNLYCNGTIDILSAQHLSVKRDTSLNVGTHQLIDLFEATLGGQLDLSRLRLGRYLDTDAPRPLLNLTDAEIKQMLTLGSFSKLDRDVEFKQARICRLVCYAGFHVVEVAATNTSARNNGAGVRWTAFLIRRNVAARALDGNSSIFHLLNGKRFLKLNTEDKKLDYIRLFCAFVWNIEGPFKIIQDASQLYGSLSPEQTALLHPPVLYTAEHPDAKGKLSDHVHACILYGTNVFDARFYMPHSGFLEMIGDKHLFALDADLLPQYDSPFRWGNHADVSDYHQDPGRWTDLNEADLQRLVPDWRLPFQHKTASLGKALIRLANASCGTLEDADGVAWGPNVLLNLENFAYSRLKATTDVTEETLSWPWKRGAAASRWLWVSMHTLALAISPLWVLLRRFVRLPSPPILDLRTELTQGVPAWFYNIIHSGMRNTGTQDRLRWLEQRELSWDLNAAHPNTSDNFYESFLPQPYTHLARIYREQGDDAAANAIEEQRIRIEHWLHAKQSFAGKLLLPFYGLFGIGFRYGLSPLRACGTVLFFLLLGWAAVHFANDKHLLTENTTTAATVITTAPKTGKDLPGIPYAELPGHPDRPPKTDFFCSDAISEPLYAVDVFIPLLDLRQETRCDVRSPDTTDTSPLRAYKQTPGWFGRRVKHALASLSVYPPLWQWLKALYAVVGWIITSLAILTFSGTLRKWGQE